MLEEEVNPLITEDRLLEIPKDLSPTEIVERVLDDLEPKWEGRKSMLSFLKPARRRKA